MPGLPLEPGSSGREPPPAPVELPPARVVGPTPIAQILRIAAAIVLAVAAALLIDYVDLPRWAILIARIAFTIAGVTAIALQPAPRRWLRAVSLDQWRAIDAETDRTTTVDPHIRVLVVAVTCAISLTIQEYVGGSDRYEAWFPYDGSEYWELMGFVWWTSWRVIGYVVLPVIVILALPGERLRDYHLSGRGFFKHLWIYGVMFVVFSPIVFAASTSDSFRETYPFYRMANRSQLDLWAWESMYVVQFMALEFFFRGFLLQSMRRVLGSNAIFMMIIPYCMIHYGKPVAETFGAIGAGLVLGTLAMRTRSIWGGVLIHVGVALTMDVLALRGCPPMGSDEFCH